MSEMLLALAIICKTETTIYTTAEKQQTLQRNCVAEISKCFFDWHNDKKTTGSVDETWAKCVGKKP